MSETAAMKGRPYSLAAQRQYDLIYKLQKYMVAFYFIASEVFTYSPLHDLSRVLIIPVQLFFLCFTDAKQPLKAHIVWHGLFVLYFFFHTLLGVPIDGSLAIVQLSMFLGQVFAFNAMIHLFVREEGLQWFMDLFSVATVGRCIFVLVFQGNVMGEERLGTIEFFLPVLGRIKYNSNTLGMACALVFLFQIYLLAREKKQYARIFIMLFCLVITLMSGSRKALIVLLSFVFLFVFFYKPKQRVATILMVVVVLLVMSFLLLNIEPLYRVAGHRIEDTFRTIVFGEAIQESSAKSRDLMIEIGIERFLEKPILGYGLTNFQLLSYYRGVYSHNNYIELAISGGAPALIIYYWYYGYIIIKNFTQYKDDSKRKIRALSICPIMILPMLDYGWVSYCSGLAVVFLAISSTLQARVNLEAMSNGRKKKKEYAW